MNRSDLNAKLTAAGQSHLVSHLDSLDESARAKLMAQLQSLDLDRIAKLVNSVVKNKAALPLPNDISPAPAYPNQPDAQRRQLYQQAEQRGYELLRAGQVGAFLVAGGQGTRLGYEGPKGEYPVTPITKKPLFQVFAEQLRGHGQKSGKPIPWYIMTSDINDAPTRAFFAKHDFFGYDPSLIMFFPQGMMPAFAFDGKMLLAAPDSLALSPDGHGGSLQALARSGALADMQNRGVQHLSYFQVDNPMVHCIDPLFIGLHDVTGSEMSSKSIPKATALEKVGNFCIGDGKLQVIEYSDLPESLALKTNADSSLVFNAGSIAIHALRVSFIGRLTGGGGVSLPWHRAEKKVPYIDSSGKLVKPDSPNAVKLEQFVFDAVPLANNSMVYTTDRAEEFSPVKNAEGVDSPATSRRDQIRRAARWLGDAGTDIPSKDGEPDATLEISPLLANSAQDLSQSSNRPNKIDAGASVYLE